MGVANECFVDFWDYFEPKLERRLIHQHPLNMSFQFNENQVAAYHHSTLDQLVDTLHPLLQNHFFDDAQSILDVGCGEGKITASIFHHFPDSKVTGCDVSEAMIAFANKKYPHLSFLQKDACSLGFHQEFDRVISINCLHWIKDQKKALKEIFASLKENGKAFLVVSPKSSQDDLQKLCKKLVLSWKWIFSFLNFRPVHSFHTQSEYIQILQDLGFSSDHFNHRKKEVYFNDLASVEVFLKAVLTPLYHLPEKKRSLFLNDLFNLMKKNGNILPNGQVKLAFNQLEMTISKKNKF